MDLFGNSTKKTDDDFLNRQLIKLGDMMGDGLHHEPGGKWIEKEYRAVAKALMPEMYADIAKKKRDSLNERMRSLLLTARCNNGECRGILKQARSGSKVCNCMICGARYKVTSKKAT